MYMVKNVGLLINQTTFMEKKNVYILSMGVVSKIAVQKVSGSDFHQITV